MNQDTFAVLFTTLRRYVKNLPTPVVELINERTDDVFKVLVTTILSARTKDQTVTRIITNLFTQVQVVDDFETLTLKQIEQLIYPVGFYHNKAKQLKELPLVLEKEFNGIIPSTVEELMKLPGVGRKTANLVVAVGFKKPAICVDTHVHRIMNRFGYVKTKTPFATEMSLRKKLPSNYWLDINWMLVSFGQHHCTPISPKCSTCPVQEQCEQVGVTRSR
ncbi:endonuclease III [Candidatus Woesearchaeota archaeon]|nr:endonuclease III [Candidatus Woesearchaeota archaeon]